MIKKNQDKEWHKKFRNLWDIKPMTRVKGNEKDYRRSKEKQSVRRTDNGE